MPPKRSKKTKTVAKVPKISDDVVERVSSTVSWPAAIEVVREHYQLPELSSKRGLKECFKRIDAISKILVGAFDGSESYARVRGAIIGIWGKLSYDAILRDKLVTEGILPRIVSMLQNKETCIIVLQTLTTITRHGGVQTRYDVARIATPDIIETLRSNSASSSITHLAVPILAHTVGAVYTTDEPIFHKFPEIKMADVLEATHDALANAPIDLNVLSHGHEVMASTAHDAYDLLEKHQPSLDFIVACFRASDLKLRMSSLITLLTFHRHHHVDETGLIDQAKQMAGVQRLPPHLQNALLEYGSERSDTHTSMRASMEYAQAQVKAAQTRNFFELGLKLGELVTQTESCIGESWFHDGHGNSLDLGLPYTSFIGALPVAAAALRQRDPVKYADMADMIELKFHMSRRDYVQIDKVSEAAMKRSSHAFWYYMRSLAITTEGVSGLRWDKLGLKCPNTTDYIRRGLLGLAAKHAADDALAMLQTPQTPESMNLVLALFKSALDDSMVFVQEAPLDCRGMRGVLTIAILMTILLKGKDLSPDLRELKPLREKLQLADEFSIRLQNGVALTDWRRSYETVIERYERAAKFWDHRLENSHSPLSKEDSSVGDKFDYQEGLAEWLSTMVLEDGQKVVDDGCSHGLDQATGISFIDNKAVNLYKCSFCCNPSASLKKCSRCGTARYCDSECQKKHWKAHKSHCVQSMSA